MRNVLFEATLATVCPVPVLAPVVRSLRMRGKPHKLVVVAIADRLVTFANAIPKTGAPRRQTPVTQAQALERRPAAVGCNQRPRNVACILRSGKQDR